MWTKQTNPYNQGYIYVGQDQAIRTNKDIYTLSSVKTSLLRVAPTDISSNLVQQQKLIT